MSSNEIEKKNGIKNEGNKLLKDLHFLLVENKQIWNSLFDLIVELMKNDTITLVRSSSGIATRFQKLSSVSSITKFCEENKIKTRDLTSLIGASYVLMDMYLDEDDDNAGIDFDLYEITKKDFEEFLTVIKTHEFFKIILLEHERFLDRFSDLNSRKILIEKHGIRTYAYHIRFDYIKDDLDEKSLHIEFQRYQIEFLIKKLQKLIEDE